MSLFVKNLPPFRRRLVDVLIAFGILIDGIACFLWKAPLYLFGMADKVYGFDLISRVVGVAAINGHRWALRAERVIDAIFGAGHCREAAAMDLFRGIKEGE